jgi:hypothetical protein
VLQYTPHKPPKALSLILQRLRCERSPRTALVYAVAFLLRTTPEVPLFGTVFRRPR